jgi:hypothetical protein
MVAHFWTAPQQFSATGWLTRDLSVFVARDLSGFRTARKGRGVGRAGVLQRVRQMRSTLTPKKTAKTLSEASPLYRQAEAQTTTR